MGILDNVFVKKAVKSMVTEEQFKMIEKLTTAVQSGKINQNKLRSVAKKVSNLSTDEINNLLDLIDKNI